jgi:hypothetical protein
MGDPLDSIRAFGQHFLVFYLNDAIAMTALLHTSPPRQQGPR